jgi:phospho-N-acetylmuramoyl-pentapeptide-transferase
MDGLAAGTSSQVFATMALIFLATGQINFAVMSAIMAGAVLGFLLWNRNPAAVFMGDTGSLFIGGIMAALVIAGGIVIWFIPLSLIYNAEALSVMAQVAYYKLTKPFTPEKPMSVPALAVYKLTHKLPGEGKRIFRMAPLHHHFEAVFGEKGVAEWEVVVGFWIAQFILCVVTLAFLYFWR